jgi:hypothetical protein
LLPATVGNSSFHDSYVSTETILAKCVSVNAVVLVSGPRDFGLNCTNAPRLFMEHGDGGLRSEVSTRHLRLFRSSFNAAGTPGFFRPSMGDLLRLFARH